MHPSIPTTRDGPIVLISPCGHGNLGDAAIQDGVIAYLGRRFPGTKVVAATLNTADTEQRHGVPGFPLIAVSREGYHQEVSREASSTGEVSAADPRETAWGGALALSARVTKLFLSKRWRRVLRRELRHIGASFRLLRHARYLVVSGGGQLDEFWGGPWGHPYTMAKWSILARLRGARVVILSVGFGTIESAWGRSFVGCALALAHYRSYRDMGSKALAAACAPSAEGSIVPDLAYGLESPRRSSPAPNEARRLRIGVSPLGFRDPRGWPLGNASLYRDYLDRLAAVTSWLIGESHDVVVLTSTRSDMRAARDLLSRIDRIPSCGPLQVHDATTVGSFITAAASLDAVIASRLHAILLGHVAGTPAIALSYERKVEALMESMGHDHLCLDITTFDVDAVRPTFLRLVSELDALKGDVATKVEELREKVNAQYRAVFSG